MNRLLFALIFVAFSTSAFAKHVYPKSLKTVQAGATYQLQENYIFKEKSATFTLYAGTYTQYYEDSKASYLIGDKNCLEMSVVPPKNPDAAWAEKWDCGIFLPKDSTKGAAFFMIRKTPDQPVDSNQGPIIDAILRAGYGSFDFPTSKQNDEVLRKNVVLKP